jgi:hypothetical protein
MSEEFIEALPKFFAIPSLARGVDALGILCEIVDELFRLQRL